MSSSDYITLIYYSSTDPTCNRCQRGNLMFDTVTESLDGIIQFIVLDCTSDYIQEDEQLKQGCKESLLLPQIYFSPQTDRINPHQNMYEYIPFTQNFDLKTLTNFINKIIINYVKTLYNKNDLTKFISNKKSKFKCFYITDEEEIPLHIKALASHLYQNASFASIDSDLKLAKKFEVKTIPTFVLQYYNSETNNINEFYYSGPDKYIPIRKWIEQYLKQFSEGMGISEKQIEQEEQEQYEPKQIPLSYLEEYLEEQHKWVFVQIKKDEDHSLIKQIVQKFGTFFKYFEVICDEFCSSIAEVKFKLQQFPSLLVYGPGQKQQESYIDVTELQVNQIVDRLLLSINEKIQYIKPDEIKEFINETCMNGSSPVLSLISSQDNFTKLIIGTFQLIPRYTRFIKTRILENPIPELVQEFSDSQKIPLTFGIIDYNEQSEEYRRFLMDKRTSVKNYYKFFNILNKWKLIKSQNTDELNEANQIEKFRQLCTLSKNPCIIGLFNSARQNRFKLDIEEFKKAMLYDINFRYNWVWIDAACHNETLDFFRVGYNNLNLVIYYDSAKNKYQIMKGILEEQNIQNFLDDLNTLRSLDKNIQYDNELTFTNKDCVSQTALLKQQLSTERSQMQTSKSKKAKNSNEQTKQDL